MFSKADIQKDGTFVKEWFYEKNTLGNGAVWDIAIWPDPKQTYLLSADGENNEIRILKREDGSVVGKPAATAAMPDNSTGFTPWRWMPKATYTAEVTPESESRSSRIFGMRCDSSTTDTIVNTTLNQDGAARFCFNQSRTFCLIAAPWERTLSGKQGRLIDQAAGQRLHQESSRY